MKLLLTVAVIVITSHCFAQRQNVYFLKNDGRYVEVRDSADYVRVVREPDSASALYNVFEFYLDGKKKLIGKSSKIYPPIFEGSCTKFYKSGIRQCLTNYKNGLPVDKEYQFFPSGKPYLVKEYSDNNNPYTYLDNNYLIQESYDTIGTVVIQGGNGYYKGYDESFNNVIEEGKIKNGKRDSVWKGDFKKDTITFTETYQDGKLITGVAIFRNGITTTYTKSRGIPPRFKGGIESFYKYLGTSIHYPSEAREKNIQGRVILTFIVEKTGQVNNVTIAKSINPSLDAEAARVIKNSPLWIPAMYFGRNVRVVYSVPISFTLSN